MNQKNLDVTRNVFPLIVNDGFIKTWWIIIHSNSPFMLQFLRGLKATFSTSERLPSGEVLCVDVGHGIFST